MLIASLNKIIAFVPLLLSNAFRASAMPVYARRTPSSNEALKLSYSPSSWGVVNQIYDDSLSKSFASKVGSAMGWSALDMLTAIAYISISLELMYYLRITEAAFPFPHTLRLFALLACITGVLFMVLGWQVYYVTPTLMNVLKLAIACIACITSVISLKNLPAARLVNLNVDDISKSRYEQNFLRRMFRHEQHLMFKLRALTHDIRRSLNQREILRSATSEITSLCQAEGAVVIKQWNDTLVCEEAYVANGLNDCRSQSHASGTTASSPCHSLASEEGTPVNLLNPFGERERIVGKTLTLPRGVFKEKFRARTSTDIDFSVDQDIAEQFDGAFAHNSIGIVTPIESRLPWKCWLVTVFNPDHFSDYDAEEKLLLAKDLSTYNSVDATGESDTGEHGSNLYRKSFNSWYSNLLTRFSVIKKSNKYEALCSEHDSENDQLLASTADLSPSGSTPAIASHRSNSVDSQGTQRNPQEISLRLSRLQVEGMLFSICGQIGIALEQALLIQQQKQKTDELAQQNALLDKARQESKMVAAQKEFLAIMSHELRTPLFACSSMSQLLLDCSLIMQNSDTNEGLEALNLVEVLKSSNDMLVDIVNNVLDFSKYESLGFKLERRPFKIRETVEKAAEIVCMQDHANKFPQVVYFIDSEVPEKVSGDELRVRQILTNLLSNACKFTPHEGSVTCTVELSNHDELDASLDLDFTRPVESHLETKSSDCHHSSTSPRSFSHDLRTSPLRHELDLTDDAKSPSEKSTLEEQSQLDGSSPRRMS